MLFAFLLFGEFCWRIIGAEFDLSVWDYWRAVMKMVFAVIAVALIGIEKGL